MSDVCVCVCVCVSVFVSMSVLSQELEVKQVYRSHAAVCIDHECLSGPSGSHMAQMLRQHQALIHLTGTYSQ